MTCDNDGELFNFANIFLTKFLYNKHNMRTAKNEETILVLHLCDMGDLCNKF